MKKIKFSHYYNKFRETSACPENKPQYLTQIFIVDRKDLTESFIEYDTLIDEPNMKMAYYELPKGKLMVLLFCSGNRLWTTIRRWTPQKEKYYQSLIGQEFEIVINP